MPLTASASVFQWIEKEIPVLSMRVRFLPEAQLFFIGKTPAMTVRLRLPVRRALTDPDLTNPNLTDIDEYIIQHDSCGRELYARAENESEESPESGFQ